MSSTGGEATKENELLDVEAAAGEGDTGPVEEDIDTHLELPLSPQSRFNYNSRLQILDEVLNDKDVSIDNIKRICNDFFLQEVHDQGLHNVCTFIACLECMAYRFYLESGLNIKLSFMDAIKRFRSVMEGFVHDDSVSSELRDVYKAGLDPIEENGPSIQQMFIYIMRDGIYNAFTEIPYNLDGRGKMIDVTITRSQEEKLKKFTIRDFRVTTNAEEASLWLKSGPIVGSLKLYGESFKKWKKSLQELFSQSDVVKRKHKSAGYKSVGHTVILLGKGARIWKNKEVLYFLAKNSYPNWGQDGFVMINRKEFKMYGRPIGVTEK